MNFKKVLFAPIAFLSLQSAMAQPITITKADMPNVGDNINISVNTGLSGFHMDSTGANYLWDWSRLIPDSQRYVKCESALNTPYPFMIGNSSFGIRNYTPDQFPWSLMGSPPTDCYDFYKNTTASYFITAEPVTTGGTPVPFPYQSVDRVYKFPLNYLNKDSSLAVYALPNIGGFAYTKKIKRVNEVDGWGTLITPYGTFNTVRVKATLTITDSLYIDTISTGFTIPRPISYEVKWLAQGMKIPLLEIDATATGIGNVVTITRANWRDSLLTTPVINFAEQPSCPIVNEGSLTANTSGLRYPLTYSWSTGATTPTISNLAPGLYTVTVTDRYGRSATAVDSVRTLTDSSCMILVSFATTKTCPMTKDGALTATVTGARNPSKYLWSTGDTTLSIKNLSPGDYNFTVTDKYGRQTTATGTVEGYSMDISCLNIPSAFTPDNDGVNDTWNIRSLSEYGDCSVEIFNQWGSLVYKSKGYEHPWDGKYNGEAVAAGAYYYVIFLNNNDKKFTGTVTVIK